MELEVSNLANATIDPETIDDGVGVGIANLSQDELMSLAERLQLPALKGLSAMGDFSWRHKELFFKGHMKAELVLHCAVSLEDFDFSIDEGISTRFVPVSLLPNMQEEGADEPEPLTDEGLADFGEFVVQSLALALPAIPRRPDLPPLDQQFGDWDYKPDDKPNPFAALKDLKTNSTNQSSGGNRG